MKVRRKYGNSPTAGHSSKKEARRAGELKLLENVGSITDLREQVSFELIPAQYIDGKCVERSVVYIADFSYLDSLYRRIVEDVKSPITKTPAYIIKRKLMLWVHKILVREV